MFHDNWNYMGHMGFHQGGFMFWVIAILVVFLLVKIFKDKKLLTEPQLKEYEKGLQKILAWKPAQEVSDEAELFLWEQQSGHLIDELAWGV